MAHNGDYVFLQGGTGLAHEGQLASSCLDPSPREAVQPAVDKPLPECYCPAQKRRTSSGWLAVELQFAPFPFNAVLFSSGLSGLLCLVWTLPGLQELTVEHLITTMVPGT